MVTLFKIKCRHFIENDIELPPKSFFVKNETSIRLCYNYQTQIKYIHLATRMEVARFWKKHGLIKIYAVKGDEVKMFIKKFVTICGPRGEPVQKESLVSLEWDDIELTPGQVQTLAAVHEMENNKDLMKFIKEIFKAA